MSEMLPNLYPRISKPLEGARGRYLMMGLGRQSMAMMMMAEYGLIGPKPDAIICSDMNDAEREESREVLSMIQSPNFPRTIPLIVINPGNLDEAFTDAIAGRRERFSNPPMFVANEDGSRGRITRGCTRDYKIRPEIAEMKRLLGFKKGERMPDYPIVEQWLGFSMDEVHRLSAPPEDWIHNRFPLVEAGWYAHQCVTWLWEVCGLRINHSGCWFCPFMDNLGWLRMKTQRPHEFEKACQRDEAMRHAMPGLNRPAFIHDSLRPLREIDFVKLIAERKGDLLSWEDPSHCPSGACGV